MNWIEKAAEEIGSLDFDIGEALFYEATNRIIFKHAPVIDAEVLADEIVVMSRQKIHQSNALLFKSNISALITSNIDLNIKWVATKSSTEGSQYEAVHCYLRALISENISTKQWHWSIFGRDGEIIGDWVKSKPLAQTACEEALRKIITGVKN